LGMQFASDKGYVIASTYSAAQLASGLLPMPSQAVRTVRRLGVDHSYAAPDHQPTSHKNNPTPLGGTAWPQHFAMHEVCPPCSPTGLPAFSHAVSFLRPFMVPSNMPRPLQTSTSYARQLSELGGPSRGESHMILPSCCTLLCKTPCHLYMDTAPQMGTCTLVHLPRIASTH
jgi:hypothetical protein